MPYPVSIAVEAQIAGRNRLTTLVRPIPAGLATFGIGVMRWMLRVEACLRLLVDDYPPFAFD